MPSNSIHLSAFKGCTSLTSIDLSNTQITSIVEEAFSGCTSLTSIDLPDTLASIGEKAFDGCTSLTNIDYAGTMEEWNAIKRKLLWIGSIKTITCTDGVINIYND